MLHFNFYGSLGLLLLYHSVTSLAVQMRLDEGELVTISINILAPEIYI
jgi:hypothetical protein